jgi:hypothetical protein
VLRIKARGQRDLVTVIGHAATISAGEWLTASGEWCRAQNIPLWVFRSARSTTPCWRAISCIQTPVAIPCSPRYDIQPSLSERSGRASIDIHVSIISTGIASKLSRSVSSS